MGSRSSPTQWVGHGLAWTVILGLVGCTLTPAESVDGSSAPLDRIQDEAETEQTAVGPEKTIGESTPCRGYATRYWNCCKPHCAWTGNGPTSISVTRMCDQSNQVIVDGGRSIDACDRVASTSAHTCFDMRPWVVNHRLSYGYATVPRHADVCGRCYELSFSGQGKHDLNDAGSRQLRHKRMVVQAIGMSSDVRSGQFNLLIPGGGLGERQACGEQFGVEPEKLGAKMGGILSDCHQKIGYDNHGRLKTCVRNRCSILFGEDTFSDLLSGCDWFTDWFEVADNPRLTYREVACPDALVKASGVDRRPLGGIEACVDLTPPTVAVDRGACECDCQWTQERTQCGIDDGSCCWWACCGEQ